VQQVESQVLQPLVMRRTVSLHPAVVVLALLAAGAVYGIGGMLLAVPAVAALKVVAEYLWRRHIPWAEDPELDELKEADGAQVETLAR
ncbi:MAG TPA: AI-2E family transporter, partial [Egibacteraceae bacterium]|nr:AI-2E family transporter [Egibacteraceae bacterium]